MNYYLRVEGVNLNNFVYDTNDLSTVRGGGLLMLRLAEIFEALLSPYSFSKISVGASWGLFKFETNKTLAPRAFLDDLNKRLAVYPVSYKDNNGQEHHLYLGEYATWVLDMAKADRGFQTGRNQSHALNRWRQMQSLSLTLPKQEPFKPDIKEAVCDFDLLRPANKLLRKEEKVISRHVSTRRLYGRYQKQYFYEEETGITGLKFTEDLNQLTRHDHKGCSSEIIGNLAGKMAVIYLDGNDFGKKQRDLCKEEIDQQEFNRLVKDGQKEFLTSLLNKIKDQPSWKNSLDDNAIRIETLLWGGDEIMWVVPAWQGWWLLELFFRETETSQWKFKGEQLTHAAGMVFCHHNAPIHRIKNLAHDLAEIAKTEKEKDTGYVAYQILESFDHAGNDLQQFRAKRCPPGIDPKDLIVKGDIMGDVTKNITSLKNNPDFSKRKLYQIVQALYCSDADLITDLEKKAGFSKMKEISELRKKFGGQVFWLHLLELWDYLGVEGN